MTEQISIYAENKKGAMSNITGLLKDAEINIMSILTNDSGEFGTVRMLVSDVPLAKKVFEDAGYQGTYRPRHRDLYGRPLRRTQ